MQRICRRRAAASKKSSGGYSAAHAALGGRTLKTGQSRWFVGYKKHTLRLWLSAHREHVLLVPLVSWITPGNVGEGGLLVPSLALCVKRWDWRPDYVVADMGYWAASGKQTCRQRWQMAGRTHLRSYRKLLPPFEAQ